MKEHTIQELIEDGIKVYGGVKEFLSAVQCETIEEYINFKNWYRENGNDTLFYMSKANGLF